MDEKKNPLTRPGFVLAACFMAVLVVVALVLVLRPADQAKTASPAGSTSTPLSSPTSVGQDSRCGLAAGDQAVPASGPAADWQMVGRLAAPVTANAGPAVIDADGWRYCYAHSPTGAVVAAANLYALSSAGDHAARAVRELTVPSQERNTLMGLQEQAGQDVIQEQAATVPAKQVVGFRLATYDEAAATVELLLRFPSGDLGSSPVKVEWVEGDWLYDLPDNLDPAFEYPPDSVGFITWGAS
ncbi:MAG: hypothetical protein HGA44_22880 [Cellulomonadaceae bacterium]|nr:hypothetical protein [Cellulomonadaceae bacterium]